jgi:hypothetical protein
MVPIALYVKQEHDLREGLRRGLKMTKGRTAEFQPEDEAMAYVGAELAGIARLSHMDHLLPEGLIAQALELPRWPSEDTQRRFLKRASEGTLKGVEEIVQGIIEEEVKGGEGTIWVGGDITGIPSRGHKREGARMGYCGGKKRLCFQVPQVCVQGLPWWSDLRLGNDGCRDVFDKNLEVGKKFARKYPRRRVCVRQDAGASSKERINDLVKASGKWKNLEWVMAIPRGHVSEAWWKEHVGNQKKGWVNLNQSAWGKYLGRQRMKGVCEDVTLVAVREMKWRQRKDRRKTAPRFTVSGEVGREYLIGTSVEPEKKKARALFRLYHTRQVEELSFKDGKQSLPLTKLPSRDFEANRLHVKMVALAQTVGQVFLRQIRTRREVAGEEMRDQTSGRLIGTLREEVVRAGGKNPGESFVGVGSPL